MGDERWRTAPGQGGEPGLPIYKLVMMAGGLCILVGMFVFVSTIFVKSDDFFANPRGTMDRQTSNATTGFFIIFCGMALVVVGGFLSRGKRGFRDLARQAREMQDAMRAEGVIPPDHIDCKFCSAPNPPQAMACQKCGAPIAR